MSNELAKQISYILYSSPEEDVKVMALVKDETIWLTQKAMAELFDVNVPGISKHLKNIYDEGELSESATISILETVQNENGRSVKRNVSFYNLDAIISVGYRVNSAKATKFRIWATGILKEYIKKGFVLDDERLKQGNAVFGKDYIEDLIEREIAFNMEQFAASVNEFLEFRRYDILDGNGKVGRDQADEKAFEEYEIFNRTQKIDSDFDKVIRKIKKN